VHRAGYLDYVGIKRIDAQGKPLGELRLLGLFTSNVYSASPFDVPLLRRKLGNVMTRAGFLPKSHMQKTLQATLEGYPRDELFASAEDELFGIALGILRLQERQRTRLFVRRDLFGRFYSCFVFVPRDRFDTALCARIGRLLMRAFHGESCEFTPQLTESMLARVHYVVRTAPGARNDVDLRRVEAEIVAAARGWHDELADALTQRFGEERGARLRARYRGAFPAGYSEQYGAADAVLDIDIMETLAPEAALDMNLYRAPGAASAQLRFKLYQLGAPITLSESLPMLERMGVTVLDEHPYRIAPADGAPVWVHDIGLHAEALGELDLARLKPLFQELFARNWAGEVESDHFNRLALAAQLNWRQIAILRAYAKYFKQVGLPYSQRYIEDTLAAHPKLARKLAQLFALRFDPANGDAAAAQQLAEAIRADLDQVSNLDQDRILRQYLDTLLATTRTNYYQNDAQGRSKPYLSFKLDPAQVPNLPAPRPMFEIFVYSPRFEGVHLRGGRVARGGLRWSDRREDFRTEILGLVKAQMVKNTVIVPVGSKGGFVLKQAPAASEREAFMKEGIACYQNFLRGLLDLTDNLVDGKVVPPANVLRHDGDDPYLVVAADKGTATFSDIANGVSAEYGFWLGDAFASGGSVGYDHKKMGITARGAWESVKRHFRELGHDTQTQDVSVVGVGDMSGDVFGNGMLLSRHIKLVAAFDHRHVFIDPNPDAARSFVERERLFNLPRSSWDDYDKALLSKGGGVWPLTAKTIPLSPEARAALGVEAAAMTPTELKSAILKAPVDLLYNGGIGTYIKAASESHAQVGDRANDAIRVDGRALRCKVVAEGGNLGCTQLGRIEAALKGVKINTDAIDNSAGVDCSDHEVNIKILLNGLVLSGAMTMEQRNRLLAEMTDEVGALVLQDNYYQTQCLSVLTRRGVQLLDAQARMMHALETAGRLNRKLEFLPDDETLAERQAARTGLTAPENAVLLAYSKMTLFDALTASDLPDDPFFAPLLRSYFPRALQQRHTGAMLSHPLRREIVATVVANELINRVGSTFVFFVREETGAAEADVVRAWTQVREVFALDALWREIDALDNRVADAVQGRLLIDIARVAQRATLWFLRHPPGQDLAGVVTRFHAGIESLRARRAELLTEAERAAWRLRAEALVAERVPAPLAETITALELDLSGLDIVEVARAAARPIETVAAVYYTLDARLNHGWLRQQIALLPTDSHWQSLARAALRDELAWRQRSLTAAVLHGAQAQESVDSMLDRWEQQNRPTLTRARRVLADLQAIQQTDLAMLSVALRELRGLM
jgi:glutamate dehydrogenase